MCNCAIPVFTGGEVGLSQATSIVTAARKARDRMSCDNRDLMTGSMTESLAALRRRPVNAEVMRMLSESGIVV